MKKKKTKKKPINKNQKQQKTNKLNLTVVFPVFLLCRPTVHENNDLKTGTAHKG